MRPGYGPFIDPGKAGSGQRVREGCGAGAFESSAPAMRCGPRDEEPESDNDNDE